VKHWFVVASEPKEYERTDVFGPFYNETDARAYAIDLVDDNGWETIEPLLLTHEEAEERATGLTLWPYSNPDLREEG